jgi:hypothetical protein
MTTETLVLDPIEFAPERTELALDDLGLRVGQDGVDWGESAVAIQLSRQQTGSIVTDRHLDPVEMTIPLLALDDDPEPLATALHKLQQKTGIFQASEREPNWVRRDFDNGAGVSGSIGYMVYSAALHGLQGRALAAGVAPAITLKLLRSPLGYATEEIETELFVEESGRVLEWEIAEMLGTGPGLMRLRVDNLNASADLRGLIVPMESRDHPQDATKETTAALTYEAEDLTLRGGAVEASREGASGGKVVKHSGLTSGWLTILSSEVSGVGHMTHIGNRRLWARVYDPGVVAGTVELQLEFRALGSSRWSSTNVTVPTPLVDAFALVDLGECLPDLAALGDQRWEWRLQARAPSGSGWIEIDQIHVCPIEQYVAVSEPYQPPSPDAQTQKSPGTLENKTGVGSVAWSNPSRAASSNNEWATAALGLGATTNYLLAKNFGFAIPESATITGVVVEIEKKVSPELFVDDEAVYLVAVGEPGAGENRKEPGFWPESDTYSTYGSSSDDWGFGEFLTPANINESGFGAAIAARNFGPSTGTASVDHIRITVYYTEDPEEDCVCFAERSVEIRSDGTYRQAREDDVWGSVIVEGFNPQVPPSWLEQRALRGLIIPSQGDLAEMADSGTNKIAAQVLYRPAYHFAREAA